jgi:hypothetical protein
MICPFEVGVDPDRTANRPANDRAHGSPTIAGRLPDPEAVLAVTESARRVRMRVPAGRYDETGTVGGGVDELVV